MLRDGPLGPGARTLDLATLARPARARSGGSSRARRPTTRPRSSRSRRRSTRSRRLGARPSVNLKLFFEGEEEAGSPHLAAVLAANRELLRADAWLLCDGPVHQSRRMQVVFGARGVTDVEITVYGPSRAVHSGHYGNWAPNPALALAHLVAGLRDARRPDHDRRLLRRRAAADARGARGARRGARRRRGDAPGARARGDRGRRRAARRADHAAGAQPARPAVGSGRGEGAERDPDRGARLDRLPARARPDAGRRCASASRRTCARRDASVVHAEPTLDERRATPNLVRLDWGAGYPAARTALELPFSRRLLAVVGEDLTSR